MVQFFFGCLVTPCVSRMVLQFSIYRKNISSEKGKVSLRVLENIHSLNKYTVSKATSFEKPQPNTDQNRITTGSTESRRSHSLAYTHAQSYRDSQLQRNKVSHAHAYRKRDKKTTWWKCKLNANRTLINTQLNCALLSTKHRPRFFFSVRGLPINY